MQQSTSNLAGKTSTLIIRGMPPFRSDEHKSQFYRQLGAVHSMSRDAETAVVVFSDPNSAQTAYEQLGELNLRMEGRALQCEHFHDIPESVQIRGTEAQYPPDHHHTLPNEERFNEPLSYAYPTPNAQAIANLGYHLWTNPKFYVEVLDLAKKLRLPDPFQPLKHKRGEEDSVTHFVKVFSVQTPTDDAPPATKRPKMTAQSEVPLEEVPLPPSPAPKPPPEEKKKEVPSTQTLKEQLLALSNLSKKKNKEGLLDRAPIAHEPQPPPPTTPYPQQQPPIPAPVQTPNRAGLIPLPDQRPLINGPGMEFNHGGPPAGSGLLPTPGPPGGGIPQPGLQPSGSGRPALLGSNGKNLTPGGPQADRSFREQIAACLNRNSTNSPGNNIGFNGSQDMGNRGNPNFGFQQQSPQVAGSPSGPFSGPGRGPGGPEPSPPVRQGLLSSNNLPQQKRRTPLIPQGPMGSFR